MQLKALLKGIVEVSQKDDKPISGLALDSREVKPGNLFFAYPGTQSDGRKYIKEAITKGAVAIVAELSEVFTSISYEKESNRTIPIIATSDVQSKIGHIAAKFYQQPSKNMQVIGVTGTNGKTTCCHFLANALTENKQKIAMIGTLGNGVFPAINQPELTTPDPVRLQKLLSAFKKEAVKKVVMEVSSHALQQNRHVAIAYDIGIFTNLSRDHLDYHQTMHAYGQAKRKLFQVPTMKYAIINLDDEFGRQLANEFRNKLKVYAYSATGKIVNNSLPIVRAYHTRLTLEGISASMHTPWGDGVLHSNLLGRGNLDNLLAVVTTLGVLGIPLVDILTCLMKLKKVPGRMEVFQLPNKPSVIVDYAHTPDALRHALLDLREFTEGELWCVFGCGGDRDKGKRSLMGQIAETYVDHVILTNDNPRFEEPQKIIEDIQKGMLKPEYAVVELDRRRAIAHAISCAKEKDIILVAGKGHEAYQQIGAEKIPFNDELEVQIILTES